MGERQEEAILPQSTDIRKGKQKGGSHYRLKFDDTGLTKTVFVVGRNMSVFFSKQPKIINIYIMEVTEYCLYICMYA